MTFFLVVAYQIRMRQLRKKKKKKKKDCQVIARGNFKLKAMPPGKLSWRLLYLELNADWMAAGI